MPLLERIQLDGNVVDREDFNRLQTAIERALQKIQAGVNSNALIINNVIDGGSTTTGAAGARGIDGLDGEQGDAGMQGLTGRDGSPGRAGRDGIDGNDGDDGAPGPPGIGTQGAPGIAGVRGMDGSDGEDGVESPLIGTNRARFWISTPDVSAPYGVNMGALASGVLQLTTTAGVGVPSTVAVPGATIPFGSGSNGQLTTDVRFGYFGTELFLGTGRTQAWYNDDTANYERVNASWVANVWTLKSEKAGTGTVRSMKIDADTATLTLRGNSVDVHGTAGVQIGLLAGVRSTPQVTIGGTTSVTIVAGSASPNPSANFTASQLVLDSSVGFTAGTWAGAIPWDGIKITGGATLPGAGTNTAAFASTTFANPTITGTGVGATVNEAATVAIAGGPIASALTINLKMALWVQADAARFDGDVIIPTTANGAVATALTSLGPAGSHTTVQKWWKVKDVSGTDYYVPMF